MYIKIYIYKIQSTSYFLCRPNPFVCVYETPQKKERNWINCAIVCGAHLDSARPKGVFTFDMQLMCDLRGSHFHMCTTYLCFGVYVKCLVGPRRDLVRSIDQKKYISFAEGFCTFGCDLMFPGTSLA